MECTERSSDRSAGSEDEYRSASSLASQGDIETPASLLAVQLAVACVRLHQRAKVKNGNSGPFHRAVGLPPLKKKRKGSLEENIGDSVASQTTSLRASYGDDGYECALTDAQSKDDVQEPEIDQSIFEEETEVPNDSECLAYSSNGRQGSQRTVAGEHDDTSAQSFYENIGLDTLTARRLSDDLLQSSISWTNDMPKTQPHGSAHLEQGKEGLWASDSEFSRVNERVFDSEMNDHHRSSEATMVPSEGALSSHRKVLLSTLSEDASVNEGSEQSQPNSLFLWPFMVAFEAIAFQVRLIAQAFSLVAMLYDWCKSFASDRVHETWQAKERATEALTQKVTMLTTVPPEVTESGSMVLKRAVWGCLAALYVCLLLCILLFPALLLDYVFLSRIVEDPVSLKEPLHFDYTVANPTAIVSLHPFLGKLGSRPERTRPLPVSHKVHITVFLTLPESDYNRRLGIFQLTSELLSKTDEIIKSSSQPCILRFHSLPIRVIKTFLISLPSLLGLFTESQTLEVHLMKFEEQPMATHAVKIIVQSKAGMPLGQGIPEIYSAHVHIESHLPWLKNIMRNWKWTVYIWTGLAIYVMEIFMILCCCRQALLPTLWFGRNDESQKDEIGDGNRDNIDESGASMNRSQKENLGRRSPYEHIPIARTAVSRRELKVVKTSAR